MKRLKRAITTEDLDRMRISLSAYERKVSTEPVCDFCGDPRPIVVYAASKMSTGAAVENWRWLACEACERALDAEDWDIVKDRIASRLRRMVRGTPMASIPARHFNDAVNASFNMFVELSVPEEKP